MHRSEWQSAQAIEVKVVSKRSNIQHLYKQTAYPVEMLCCQLTQKNLYLIRLFFIRLPLQQESGA
ncbi:MAG: hypothetical protein DSM106950_11770 [Stigonema ocellatum SAG 48.90 = DSM 106950]|nr:hypothetical protein [Stigonema ocellatum SAG 48.90 = DSM 106950]